MVYNVMAIHSWSIKLGVVEYLTDGELFSDLVKRAVESFPKMKFDLPVSDLDEDELFAVLHNTMASYLQNFRLAMTRAETSRVTDFLKTLDAEHRRWNFDLSMDTGACSGVMEELIPLIKLHKANCAEGSTVSQTILDYATETLAEFFATAIVEEFQDSVVLFRTMHRDKVKGLKLILDFPRCQYNLMDMRLLIDVPEE